MVPYLWYVYAAFALLAFGLLLVGFRRGRRLLISALPALAFFLLLVGTAEAAFRVGLSMGSGVVAGAVKYTCSMHPQVEEKAKGLCPICHMELVPKSSAAAEKGPAITIDPVLVQNMGVRTTVLTPGTLQASVRAFGELRAAESRQHDIALKIGGYVEKLFADTEGMAIEKGDPLFELYSPQLVIAQEELQAAVRSGSAEMAAAARRKLELWDVSAADIDTLLQAKTPSRTFTWRSPVRGVLVQKDVIAGAPAMMNQTLLRIVDLSVLWLETKVPEAQLASVRLGQAATVSLTALPGTELTGKVVFVAPVLDAMSRTGTVRIELANADGSLKPGMFARVQLRHEVADVLLAPSDAILDTGVRQLAWIALGEGRFEPRLVRLGATGDGGMVQIVSGLQAGERVVTSGQFLIDAESRMRGMALKLSPQDLLLGSDKPAPVALDAPAQAVIDAVLAAYLRVGAAFAADRDDNDGWNELRAAAALLPSLPQAPLQDAAKAFAAAMQRDATNLPERRKALETVSEAAIALFARARPSPTFGPALRVLYCSMRPGRWLQVKAEVRNPYYGSEMLECGDEQAQLPLQPAAPNKESGK